ncbi:tetratricopeptide repeat protein [Allorhizocola rhizosphaerae]|uniref:tetratricopeptide repeat protein n=1 Tax=Allorhizocola rhizosphaerae TaxID=1872709 RepID=UPI000E3C62EB|nr:hypothetical protein [Allorhizocola rhizosphaerae]
MDLTDPLGCTWGRYVQRLADEHGGWTALTHLLMRRAGPSAGLPEDPGSVERGLRRLRSRGNAPGGQYGQWLLEHFGVPRPLDETARWMGQYHSRFSDLPLSMCEAQLRLWDRPPISESPAACWIRLGLASIAMRRGDIDTARLRLHDVGELPPAARIEADLLHARLGDREALSRARAQIAVLPRDTDRDCYHARWADQRAYQLARDARYAAGARFYRSIDPDSPAAFALFRRHHGLAYCHWKLGDPDRAAEHAEAALDHAGDAGLLRLRVMALRLLAHIRPGEAARFAQRADRIAQELEHLTSSSRP